MITPPHGDGSHPEEKTPVPREAPEDLLTQVYAELRRLAGSYLRHERAGHTLQPTALVHEAWLRLSGSNQAASWDRREFTRAAAVAMRRILVTHARDRGRIKRGGEIDRVSLEGKDLPAGERALDLVALDEALAALQERDPRKARIVELRFFGGLLFEEIAECLELSLATVKREWPLARAWLLREMRKGETRGN